MKKIILTILIQFGFGKNYSYGKLEKFGVEDVMDWKFGLKKIIWAKQ